MSTLHCRGSPNNGGQNQKSKRTLGVTMMPLGAPSISKYGSLVRLDAQIVALRAQCARTALEAPPNGGFFGDKWYRLGGMKRGGGGGIGAK